MIQLNQVKVATTGGYQDFIFPGEAKSIDGSQLLALPALIDPHVHFRTPGFEYKEDWRTGAKAALKGGITTVFDMPNTQPATTTLQRLQDKFSLIDQQLREVNIPLRYHLYFGADKNHFDQLHAAAPQSVGLKIFMGTSTGELLMDDDSSLHAAFALAAKLDMVVALHAEDECMIRQRQQQFKDHRDYQTHSLIRSPEVAASAVAKAIQLSQLYGTRIYLLHISTQLEIDLIKAAKQQGLPVYAETCPHYLFLSMEDYDRLQGFAQMNPALRDRADQAYLWQAIQDGTIDTLASDHAPHTISEKKQVYGCCPSGIPGVETTLPLLFTAYQQGKLTLQRLLQLTRDNPQKIFGLADNDDWVFIDPYTSLEVDNASLCTKVKWSPYAGMRLSGWPKFISLRGKLYDLDQF